MTNPFESEEAQYLVLVNKEGQHSLWPVDIDIPAGWSVVHGSDSRKRCLEYVNSNWVDMRPKSLFGAQE